MQFCDIKGRGIDKSRNLQIYREGAAIWYIKRLVTGRAARFAIGTSIGRVFNPLDPNHQERVHLRHKNDEYVRFHKSAERRITFLDLERGLWQVDGIFHKWAEKVNCVALCWRNSVLKLTIRMRS